MRLLIQAADYQIALASSAQVTLLASLEFHCRARIPCCCGGVNWLKGIALA